MASIRLLKTSNNFPLLQHQSIWLNAKMNTHTIRNNYKKDALH